MRIRGLGSDEGIERPLTWISKTSRAGYWTVTSDGASISADCRETTMELVLRLYQLDRDPTLVGRSS
ncbi:unnamed protein product [Mycena citricolor]|uniref:Uncharacterized protein n=2 Tax=Mycena citricolor TaxID=2018698 RepID=A0AAD2JXD7_9AGAR|nr:unnamed protein product [Mycena citricolor]